MFETKYSKFLTVLLIVIIVAIIGLLGYLGFDYYKNYRSRSTASEFVDTFKGEDIGGNISDSEDEGESGTQNEVSGNILGGIQSSGSTGSSKKTYNGFEVIGTIDIPATNLNYPVLAKVTKKSLETAVAALYPEKAVLNTEGNVVIVGHNYRNGSFFSNNKKLVLGDKVYITDLEGNKVTYVIYNIFEASETDTSFYNRDTNGAKEITLSTCTDDSKARLIIQAKAE